MDKYEIVSRIEEFAPLETQEPWDCSGWIVDAGLKHKNTHSNKSQVSKVMFALTVTQDIVNQARKQNCDMIISHHPLFCVPLEYSDINIYSAHTNFDIAQGGTTDILIEKLGFSKSQNQGFVRICKFEKPVMLETLKEKLLSISPNLRYVNNQNIKTIKSIAFCAGSGSEFIDKNDADAFVTGDVKFHAAIDSNQVVFDIGHFESEIFAPQKLKEITMVGEKGVLAYEKSPFN